VTASFGDVDTSGGNAEHPQTNRTWPVSRRSPNTPGSGLLSTDWLAGPSYLTQSRVVLSFNDFHSYSGEDCSRSPNWA
jgi:hypothetical protein